MSSESISNLVTVVEANESFETILRKEYIPQEYIENIKQASLLILPYENYRDDLPLCFPEYTEELYRYLHSHSEISTEICVRDADFQILELHASIIKLGEFLIKDIIFPIVINLFSSFLYYKAKSLNQTPKETGVDVNLLIDKEGKCREVRYSGSVEDFEKTLKALHETMFL